MVFGILSSMYFLFEMQRMEILFQFQKNLELVND